MKTVYSIKEAAEYLGVFSLTLRNWDKKNYIKSFRTPGKHRRFKIEELDRIRNGDFRNPKDSLTIDRKTFHMIACEFKPSIAFDSQQPEWSVGELDKLYDALLSKKDLVMPVSTDERINKEIVKAVEESTK